MATITDSDRNDSLPAVGGTLGTHVRHGTIHRLERGEFALQTACDVSDTFDKNVSPVRLADYPDADLCQKPACFGGDHFDETTDHGWNGGRNDVPDCDPPTLAETEAWDQFASELTIASLTDHRHAVYMAFEDADSAVTHGEGALTALESLHETLETALSEVEVLLAGFDDH